MKFRLIKILSLLIILLFLEYCKENKPINDKLSNDLRTYYLKNKKHQSKIYQVGDEFTYSLSLRNKIDSNISNKSGVDSILIEVVKYKLMSLKFRYPPKGIVTTSSIIENDSMVWIHPPRQYIFKILELNPFPYVQKPIVKGKKWNWNLKIGEQYADCRWKVWEGEITNIINYEIIKDTMLTTKLGLLYCHVISSNARSRLGNTSLISFFNDKYGFVKLDYTNIDSTKITLELVNNKIKTSIIDVDY